jgi:YbgC/YbaW family acyl-CoA thioester hydrolase
MHRFSKTINFYDCDPAGVLFFARLFEICHSAYEDLINSFKLKLNYWNNDAYAVPIIHTEGEYMLPLKAGDKVTIETTVSKLKESSFELKYVLKNTGGKITNEAKTVHIFVDKLKWKKIPISPDIKDNLAKHIE